MALIIEKTQINNFLEDLKRKIEVFDIRKDTLPPKQYFFPPKEEIFSYNKKTKRVSVPKPKKKALLFGLNLDDLEAMTQLDEVMRKPKTDNFYFQRKNRTLRIGLTDVSIKSAPPGGDLIFEKINSREYQVLVWTPQGKKIARQYNKFFKKTCIERSRSVKNPKIKNYPDESRPMKKLKELLLDSEFLADAISWSWKNDSKIWDELAEICLGCGICSYVCPLCYCFSTEDRAKIDGKECVRYRQWDACTLPEFSKISGGHNFHKTLKERYYNWFHHKFVRGYKEYGKSLCVACGRCQKYCPAGINIETWIVKIIKDYEKHLLTPRS